MRSPGLGRVLQDILQECAVPAESSCASESLCFAEIQTSEVHHWPIIRAYAERLGLRGLINRLVPSERSFEPGLIVLAMVIDTLSGRSPLYHLESFFEDKDTEVLLGEAVDASLFNDDNAGAVLDLLYEVGTQKIYSEVAMAALRAFEVSTEHVHFDTTSVSLYGDYLSAAGEDSPLQITHGFSKNVAPGYMWRQPVRGLPPSRASVCAAHISASATARAGTP